MLKILKTHGLASVLVLAASLSSISCDVPCNGQATVTVQNENDATIRVRFYNISSVPTALVATCFDPKKAACDSRKSDAIEICADLTSARLPSCDRNAVNFQFGSCSAFGNASQSCRNQCTNDPNPNDCYENCMNKCSADCVSAVNAENTTCRAQADERHRECIDQATRECTQDLPIQPSNDFTLPAGESHQFQLPAESQGDQGPRYQIVATLPSDEVVVYADREGRATVTVTSADGQPSRWLLSESRDGLASCSPDTDQRPFKNNGGQPANTTIVVH